MDIDLTSVGYRGDCGMLYNTYSSFNEACLDKKVQGCWVLQPNLVIDA